MELSTRATTMYATINPRTPSLAADTPATVGHLHGALLTTAAVIIGGFLIAMVLVVSVLLASPLPAADGAAPVPQVMPQPSVAAGLDR
ncbi:MAG TPA: hypothetical protein VJY85_06215 [Candidatus Limnocylindria bacterium]|nr:hypothetical protein [Candidatus Limnocylindria bacterium]